MAELIREAGVIMVMTPQIKKCPYPKATIESDLKALHVYPYQHGAKPVSMELNPSAWS